MTFLELTKCSDNKKALIRTDAISAVLEIVGGSKVFVIGDMIPFEVKESTDKIKELIEDIEK